MTTQVEKFWNWVEEEREKRGMSYRAIEEAGGVSNGAVSGRARRLLPPTANTIRAISRAFNLPFDFVAKQTSSHPTEPENVMSLEEARALFNRLPDWQQDLILAQMRLMVKQNEQQEAETGELKPGTAVA